MPFWANVSVVSFRFDSARVFRWPAWCPGYMDDDVTPWGARRRDWPDTTSTEGLNGRWLPLLSSNGPPRSLRKAIHRRRRDAAGLCRWP